tara:strand:+ start:237 stop:1256 length:1020 start_codon:yes stop_codon:yes gene_type:complete
MIFDEIIKKGKEKLKQAGIVESEICEGNKIFNPSVPGIGGIGNGVTFFKNRCALERFSIQTKMIGDHFIPNLSTQLFGEELSAPIFVAPMSGIKTNLNNIITEQEFSSAILEGCQNAGTLGICGDSYDTNEEYIAPSIVEQFGGICVLKPRTFEEIKKRVELLKKTNVTAIGIDLDGIASRMFLENGKANRKSKKELKEIRALFSGPMFLKGILSIEDASIAYESGFDAIVVSNHGGRSIDHCPATIDVLPDIAKEFKGKMKIFVDGGVRSGYDIFIYLALGADAVLVGRTALYGAMGGGAKGVKIVIAKLISDLYRAMVFTGCKEIENITMDLLKKYE